MSGINEPNIHEQIEHVKNLPSFLAKKVYYFSGQPVTPLSFVCSPDKYPKSRRTLLTPFSFVTLTNTI